ncbi:Histidinol-phosphatase [Rubripirellula amarantea]|uniref:Histidinol-phosphatase n=1 Tax=Rubripirellula amarantea TaxID=2527999 RepID=A0A5C5WSS9_9BACT|nr:histidinol-phosphatase [Rubripirellula amarantea]TWT53209.1 Histidinol-phosphatase [Rubripirellula amarantea]
MNTQRDPSQWQDLHEGRLAAMIEVATAAGAHTLKYFRNPELTFDAKSDASPVTIADREAEQLVRDLITERFPTDTMQGEEFAEKSGSSDYRWVVDPIDGTKSFICGVPLYSTLLALEWKGEPLGGVIFIPALNEIIVAAMGHGSWVRVCDASWQAARVSNKTSIDEAVFVVSQVDSFAQRGAKSGYESLESSAFITRSWGDGYGYLMVATGRADIMVDPICNAWDVAAILPIIVEAGGTFTDWKGVVTCRGGDGVGTNGKLHNEVLKALGSK